MSDINERTIVNLLESNNSSYNWELSLNDPLTLESINQRCSNHSDREVYLNIKEWTSDWDRHWFKGDSFQNKHYCYDCSKKNLDYLYNHDNLFRYNYNGEGEKGVKVLKLDEPYLRGNLVNPLLKEILYRKTNYQKVMKKERII